MKVIIKKNIKFVTIILLISLTVGLTLGYLIQNEYDMSDFNNKDDSCNIRKPNKNEYITEYIIPQPCSAPIAITVDEQNTIWFIENNFSKLVSFDPKSEIFTEFVIKTKSVKGVESWSLISIKEDLWFTDHKNNMIWKFNKEEKSFSNFIIPTKGSYPVQIINDSNNNIWVAEIFGNKIAKLDINEILMNTSKGIKEIEPPIKLDLLGGISIDSNDKIWFTILTWPVEGKVISFMEETNEFKIFELPKEITSPVGIVIKNEMIWITDHGSSQFVLFDLKNNTFTKFSTSLSTSQFSTTLPYWNKFDSKGNMWFNVHQANTIAKFDMEKAILIEYDIPTRNKNWGNISNSLQFDVDKNDNIWFTEWTESKIAFLNSSKEIPFSIESSTREIQIQPNSKSNFMLKVETKGTRNIDFSASGTFSNNGKLQNITVEFNHDGKTISGEKYINVIIDTDKKLNKGEYTLMISARNEPITISIPIKLIVV